MANDKSIFISYSWKDYKIANGIDNDFRRVGFTLERDVRDAPNYNSLTSFMKRIRENKYAILLVSDAYLKSVNCMYEVMEFSKEKDFESRILPILLKNATKIRGVNGRAYYIRYWNDKFKEIQEQLIDIPPLNTIELQREVKKIQYISQEIDKFLSLISDKKSVDLDELEKSNYKAIWEYTHIKNPNSIVELLKILLIDNEDEQYFALQKYAIEHNTSDMFYFVQAECYKRHNKYKLSKLNYEKAIELNPNNAGIYNDLAMLLDSEAFNDYDSAKENYEIAIRLNPNSAIIHSNFAKLLLIGFNDNNGSRIHFEKAIEIDPTDFETHLNLANLLASAYNDYSSAKEHFEKAIEWNPNYFEAYYNLAVLLDSKVFNDYENARKNYEKVIHINSNFADAHYNLANLLHYKFKEYINAKKHYEKAIKIDKNSADAHYFLAQLLKTQFNDDIGANKHFKRAYELNPKLITANFDLTEFY